MPEHLRIVNWKNRVKSKSKIEKAKDERVNFWQRLNRVYMDDNAANNRIRELEELLGSRYVTLALPFLRIHYISNNKPDEAAEVKILFAKICKSLGNE